MNRIIPLLVAVAVVPGCGMLNRLSPKSAAAPAVAQAASAAAPVLGVGKTAATLDTTTAAQRQEALAVAPVASERALGTLTVSLGSPTEQGFWLRSTLVQAPAKGRVEVAGGASVAVDLLPAASGAQLSLAAFRALGLSLTALPEVDVYAQ